ncbi:glycosyltransferase [Plantactinospora sonchi]|uniref:Glycosyltransferase n=1 Tax=Plantactinospora sonchi TaxID=1544735 RepID=A0ABU7RW26_9ACTN
MTMRVLFFGTPALGHLIPLFPLARALRGQGHPVSFVTAAGMAPLIGPEGFDVVPAGPMPDVLFAEVARRTGTDPAANPTPEGVAEFFGGTRIDLAGDEALAGARAFAPDLIVAEQFDLVAPLVARALGVPLAMMAVGPAAPAEFFAAFTAVVRPRYRDRGLPEPEHAAAGDWLLDTCPPSLQFPGVRPLGERLPLRPEPHRSDAAGPELTLPPPSGRPRVLLSFGSHFAEPRVVSPFLRGLATLDIDLVATTGLVGRAEDYDVDPERVLLTPFVPLARLLPGVSVVVGHGGAGTTLGTLARGVPMVVVPQGADQFLQADRVTAAGAGIAVPPGQQDPATVAAAVRRVLAEPGFTDAARRVRDDVAAMPSPDRVAEQLVAAVAR